MRLRIGSLLLYTLLVLSVTAVHAASPGRTAAQGVVSTYYSVLNAAMQSGDVAGVAAAYAPDAVLTQSNVLGVTKVFRGRAAITAYYKGLYAKLPGLHFTLVGNERDLSPSTLFRYERASTPSMTVPARCAHLFVIRGGMIATDDWVTYFAGK